MVDYPAQDPQKKKTRTTWLIGCGAALLIASCVIVFVFIGGYAGLRTIFSSSEETWNVSVNSPTSAVEVGKSFQIIITVENTSQRNIVINSIGLPNELVSNALVTGVSPMSDSQQFGDQGMTTYRYSMSIAPEGIETFVFDLSALSEGDVRGNISIQTESTTKSTGFRVVISTEVAAESQEGDETPSRTPASEGMIIGTSVPYQSVVKITALFDVDGELYEGWTGSGTIVSKDGLILTNAHVVLSDRFFTVADLVVAITQEQDSPPVNMFLADVVQADENLDLAVIKIRSRLDGSAENFSDLGITPVPFGDSGLLQLGDAITILGYPGIGGETITLTKGEVSGFTPQTPYGNRAFIKTSATIAGGNSGGLAVNDQGQIIGIPTQLGTGNEEDIIVDCRPLADTNRDGVINNNDVCVSTGGFINALRPISLALPLIDSAKQGEVAIIPEETSENHEEYQPEGNVIIDDAFVDNRNNWALGDFDHGWIDILDDQMVITIDTDSYVEWTSLPDDYDALIMVAEVQLLNPVGDGEAGFVCGYQDNANFTILEVSEDGYYSIWKYQDDEFVSLVDWTYSDAIDLSQPFTLAAYCGPDGLRLAINDVLLTQVVDEVYVSGMVGLMAGTWDNPGVSIGFDRFVIMNP